MEKIKAVYSNSAQIPDGLSTGMNPHYELQWEFTLPPKTSKVETSQMILKEMKAIVDPIILIDMKEFRYVRMKCTCKHKLWAGGQVVHDSTCLMGTADGDWIEEKKKTIAKEAVVKKDVAF